MSEAEAAGQGSDAAPDAARGGSESEIPASAAYRVSLPEFEGPLDLLLYLCKTHEIDILDIQISFITEKYLEYLDLMESLSVEIASEYLVMAATLAYLKSRELVPAPEPLETVVNEDGQEELLDPREELIRRLLEYQKYKDAAEKLGSRPIDGKTVFGRGFPLDPGEEIPGQLAEHSPWKLIELFAGIIKTAGPKTTHNVVIDRMSISERINQLVDRLETGGGSFVFESVIDYELPEPELRHQVVVTLLAVLELARLKTIRVLLDNETQTFFIATVEGASLEEARRAYVTSDDSEKRAQAEAEAAEAAAAEAAAAEAAAAEDAEPDPELEAFAAELGLDLDGDRAGKGEPATEDASGLPEDASGLPEDAETGTKEPHGQA